jgi:hypothetical protein
MKGEVPRMTKPQVNFMCIDDDLELSEITFGGGVPSMTKPQVNFMCIDGQESLEIVLRDTKKGN